MDVMDLYARVAALIEAGTQPGLIWRWIQVGAAGGGIAVQGEAVPLAPTPPPTDTGGSER